MTPAYGYLRVSGIGQSADDRDGFPRQQQAISEYAAKNDLRIVKWFREAKTGAKELEDRLVYWQMLEELKQGQVKTVVIEKLDRLARDLMIQETIIADFRRHGVTLVSTMEPDLCRDDYTRKFMRQIMGAVAEYDRANTVAKLKGARQRMKANRPGWKEGRKAIGEKPGEDVVVNLILKLRGEGKSLLSIAETLDREGIRPPKAAQWHASTVRNVLRRAETTLPPLIVACGPSEATL
jgi:DNA invertase Pin-like site-specific DNA recombinase